MWTSSRKCLENDCFPYKTEIIDQPSKTLAAPSGGTIGCGKSDLSDFESLYVSPIVTTGDDAFP
jgi:hypothetical protein